MTATAIAWTVPTSLAPLAALTATKSAPSSLPSLNVTPRSEADAPVKWACSACMRVWWTTECAIAVTEQTRRRDSAATHAARIEAQRRGRSDGELEQGQMDTNETIP